MSLIRTLLKGSWQPGQVPAAPLRSLTEEGVLLLDDQLHGSVSYLSYSRVGRPGPETRAVMGAIVVTRQRFVVWAGRQEYVDVATGHPIRDTVTVPVDQLGQLCVSYPADQFSLGRTGTIEVRLRTEKAAQFDVLLNPSS
jgi:hypothetical protein